MEKNPYLMAKLGLEKQTMLRPQRDCTFYAMYIFLFLSLIQFLIILGLVFFMVYGNNRAATEIHLQVCRIQTGALTKEKANLTHLLNASRVESRQVTGQLSRLNSTLKVCTTEKMKFLGQARQLDGTTQSLHECYQAVHFFNSTYPDKVKALEAQLTAQTLQAELEKRTLTQNIQTLKAQVKKAEQKEVACQQDLLQVRTQVQKARELETQVMAELEAASQSVTSAVERALPSKAILSCNTEEVRALQTKCNNLSKQLDVYVAGLGQRLEDRVNAVTKENALLQKEKAACSQEWQELNKRLVEQEQQATQERDNLQLSCSTEKAQMNAEKQHLFSEKESLRQDLDKMRQKCWPKPPASPPLRMPGATSSFANFPGNFNPLIPMAAPNNFNPLWQRPAGLHAPLAAFPDLRPAQLNSAPLRNIVSHRTPSHTGYTKLEEGKKPIGADSISPYQPPLKPAGQPSA